MVFRGAMGRLWQVLGMALCACLCATSARAYEDQLTVAVGGGYTHGGGSGALLDHGAVLDVQRGPSAANRKFTTSAYWAQLRRRFSW